MNENDMSALFERIVTSAFRRGVLSPRLNLCTTRLWKMWRSPVPFGVGCYHPFGRNARSETGLPCHQCLSAWGAITPMCRKNHSLRDCRQVTSAFRRGVLSPLSAKMWHIWRHMRVTSAFRRGVLSPQHKSRKRHGWHILVTSAFRRGVLSPPAVTIESDVYGVSRHQCLSAWGAITPRVPCGGGD